MAAFGNLIETIRLRRMQRFWTKLQSKAERMPLQELEALQVRARRLRRPINKVCAQIPAIGQRPIPGLHQSTKWAERPDLFRNKMHPNWVHGAASGTSLSPSVSLFHDSQHSDLVLRQVQGERGICIAMDSFGFDGSYLSWAIALPKEASRDIDKNDLFRLDATVECEVSIGVLARLNIRNGPNVEKITRSIDLTLARPFAEFDLFYAEFEPHLVTDVWVDLIFERPSTNLIQIHDLICSRRPRADI